MATTSAVALCLLLAALAVFQVSLALGAPLGRFAWGGQHEVLPTQHRIGSLVSVVVYAAVAAVAVQHSGLADAGLPTRFAAIAVWVVAACFLLGIGRNAASRSKPERAVMTPLCAVLCALTVGVALS